MKEKAVCTAREDEHPPKWITCDLGLRIVVHNCVLSNTSLGAYERVLR